ncbi:MAG: transposase family protein [Proteobacteria bacterium]|nr:transposase family protein [Pseudomonadota bacterium]
MKSTPGARREANLVDLCDRAKRGDSFSAVIVLGTAIRYLGAGKALPLPVAEYLAAALQKAIDNPRQASHALGLVRTGRPGKEYGERENKILDALLKLRAQGVPMSSNSTVRHNAAQQVAAQFHVSEKTVIRIHKAYLAFFNFGAPKPAKKKAQKSPR